MQAFGPEFSFPRKPPISTPALMIRRFSITSLLVVTTLSAFLFALLGGMLRPQAQSLRPAYVIAAILAPTAAPVVVAAIRAIGKRTR